MNIPNQTQMKMEEPLKFWKKMEWHFAGNETLLVIQ